MILFSSHLESNGRDGMGIGDQSGDITKSVTDGLKGNPLCLAVVLLAAIIALFSYFKNRTDQDNEQERFMALAQKCWSPETFKQRSPGEHPFRYEEEEGRRREEGAR